MTKKLTLNKLTLIRKHIDLEFHEHPTLGDESPIVVKYGVYSAISDLWEVPTSREMTSELYMNLIRSTS